MRVSINRVVVVAGKADQRQAALFRQVDRQARRRRDGSQ